MHQGVVMMSTVVLIYDVMHPEIYEDELRSIIVRYHVSRDCDDEES